MCSGNHTHYIHKHKKLDTARRSSTPISILECKGKVNSFRKPLVWKGNLRVRLRLPLWLIVDCRCLQLVIANATILSTFTAFVPLLLSTDKRLVLVLLSQLLVAGFFSDSCLVCVCGGTKVCRSIYRISYNIHCLPAS